MLSGLWLFALPVEEYARRMPPEVITKGWGVVTVLFFGWTAAVAFADTMDPSRLILNDEGFRIEGPSHRAIVRWDDVEDFFIQEMKFTKFINYRLRSELPNVEGPRHSVRGHFEADPDTIVGALSSRLKRWRHSLVGSGQTQLPPG